MAALKARGIDYEYLLFEDEGHGFAKPENRLRFYAAAEAFLARHLGAGPSRSRRRVWPRPRRVSESGAMKSGGLVVDEVTVTFGGLTALDQVSLEVVPGEVVGVIGPNGAGKTTLFNVICGFVRPSRGQLEFDGTSLRRHRPHDLAGLGHRPHPAGRRALAGSDRAGKRGRRARPSGPRPA